MISIEIVSDGTNCNVKRKVEKATISELQAVIVNLELSKMILLLALSQHANIDSPK